MPRSQPAWSPDGNRLAFALHTTNSSNVGVINADGGGLIWFQWTGLAAPDWKPWQMGTDFIRKW
jgi:Tol biopolymer transport system component